VPPLAALLVCTATVAGADFDRDGIPDLQDDCPTDPGTVAGGGCPGAPAAEPPPPPPTPPPAPPPPRVAVQADRVDLAEPVFFETGSARIAARSHPLLADLAEALRTLPGTAKVSVEGHTDDRGPRAANLRLSQRRAEAVVAHLVTLGVPAPQLQAKGHGPDPPIAPNATPDGRGQNRRVEVLILR
jgi:OOP family OmpA-OmpF porin